ncbi:MAG TPA: histidine kinase, partial [Burkholderiales bacterium]
MRSLRARVALAAGAVLAAFVILTSIALDQAIRDSARSAREERLLGQLYLLMGAAESENDGALTFPEAPAEPRFSLPGSGLYGQVSDERGQVIWRSASVLGVAPPFPDPLAAGERRFETRSDDGGRPYFVESFGVNWATSDSPRFYTFSVAEDLAEFEAQLTRFRTSLAGWLGG